MESSINSKSEKQVGDASIPQSPEKEDAVQLGFVKQRMIDWFSPSQLAQTGLRAIISSIFGSYSDKRELQAALMLGRDSTDIFDYSDKDELWIDYVSDTGAGWNSTYSIAYLLGRKSLAFTDKEGEDYQLPRGQILVMGGDEVYPTPTWKEYNNRLTAPYRCSLPFVPQEGSSPSLFAIPGNHDWYDGLSSFLKLFCQNRWIGGWQTKQTRSYFAAKLPHNWWLWGIDIQLRADIDKPQMDYFDDVYRRVKDGDGVILCTAEPVWVYQEYQPDDKPFKNLDFFEKRYSTRDDKKLDFKLMLTGDMHHYTSFKEENTPDSRWKITAGGGGPFLHPTHQVPDLLHLNDTKYQKSASFPDSKTSRKLAWNNLKFPFINKKFGFFFAMVYLFFTWLLSVRSLGFGKSFLLDIAHYPITEYGEILQLYWKLLMSSPGLSFFLVLIFAGILAFADRKRKKVLVPWIWGILHGLLHVFLLLLAVWLSSRLVFYSWSIPHLALVGIIVFSFTIAIWGWLFSGFAMAFYLLTAILVLKIHETESFSSFRCEDFKNFVRLHISGDGITVYPIKVPKAGKKWNYNAGVKGEKPWYEPAQKLEYSLIEDPISIKN